MKKIFYIIIFVFGFLSCQNQSDKKLLEKQDYQDGAIFSDSLNTCITKDTSEGGGDFISLIKSDRYSYLLDSMKSVSVIRYKDTCKTGYQVIITVADLNYGSKDLASQLISRFGNDSINNFRLKAWNYVSMINQGENNLFICVEDRYYMNKWKEIVLKNQY